jgi:hypothetical protein
MNSPGSLRVRPSRLSGAWFGVHNREVATDVWVT